MAKPEITKSAMLGEAGEDYLKSIYRLSRDEAASSTDGNTSGRVSTQELANEMGVSAASASRMLKNLASMGLVEHELYHGARLTPQGEKVALEVIRHHRLIELYLHEALGYGWDQVHDEAERLEHYISEEFEARIFEALGRPVVDPHGEVIPTLEGRLPPSHEGYASEQQPLADVATGGRVKVRRVPAADAEKLRYLKEIGLVPGAGLRVIEKFPYGGGLRLQPDCGEGEQIISAELAREISVIVLAPAASGRAGMKDGQ